jgi:hypothetical protein
MPMNGDRALLNLNLPHPSLPDSLHVVVDEELEVRSGANLHSKIRLINNGDGEVVVNTNGQLTARAADPLTSEIVGEYSGAQTMPPRSFLRLGW